MDSDYPPPLDEFRPEDWWVVDTKAWEQMAGARVEWHVARKVFREGGDWRAHLEPPMWWNDGNPIGLSFRKAKPTDP